MRAMNEHTRSGKAIRVTVEEAEARIAELLRRAEAGERVEVVRDGKPVVELAAAEEAPAQKLPRVGAFGHVKLVMPDDWDELGPEWDEYVK